MRGGCEEVVLSGLAWVLFCGADASDAACHTYLGSAVFGEEVGEGGSIVSRMIILISIMGMATTLAGVQVNHGMMMSHTCFRVCQKALAQQLWQTL